MRNGAFIALLAVVPVSLAAQPRQPPQVARLLNDAKSVASLLKSDIATLGFFAISERGSATNAAMFNLSTERIKTLRALADQLEAPPNDSPAEKAAVDRLIPVMKEFASSAETAIARAKQSPPATEQYFKLCSDLAEELSSVISAWVDYAKTKGELDQLTR